MNSPITFAIVLIAPVKGRTALAKNTQFENMQNKYEKSMNKRIIPDWSACP